MTTLSRRSALFGLAAVAAPAVIRTPGLLMPVKRIIVSTPAEYLRVFENEVLKAYYRDGVYSYPGLGGVDGAAMRAALLAKRAAKRALT